MTTKDEALRLALGVLESLQGIDAETECVTIDVRDEIAACREALAQKDCECFAIALDAANRTKEACIKATGQKKNIETYVNAIQIAHDAAGTDFDACREALAQKDEHDPVAWMLEWTFNGEELGQRLYDDETSCKFDAGSYGGVCRPLVYGDTTPPKRQPLTDEQRYALIKEHLGLDKRRDETVIDHRTGRWTDAARYFDLMDAAIVTAEATGEQT